jgi:glycerol-3-phosphate O-acyltransferase
MAMFMPITLPLWLVILVALFAGVTFASHFLLPSVRWFFRKRLEKAVARLNARLDRPIEPFKLARRQDMIARLLYDPRVLEAIGDYATEMGIPGNVALQEARTYAREIVPAFSATLYFGVAIRATRWLSQLFFRVRLGRLDAALSHIDAKSTVVFVINHRSNMDYVLVTWLAAQRTNLSYAVGEWAHIWPLSGVIRAMGAYYIRRSSRNTLYRRVLARYVQMATEDGTTQAIFPEGGLSLTGEIGAAKMGLLSYIAQAKMPPGRDVVFVPVGLAYDRVIEDRILVRAHLAGTRRFAAHPREAIGFGLRLLGQILRRRFAGFGSAAAGFAAPVSLASFQGTTEELGAHLMAAIAAVVPVLPVPLIAAALQHRPASEGDLLALAQDMAETLARKGAVLKLPRADRLAHFGLHPLIARGIVRPDLTIADPDLLQFYAAPLAHWFAGNAATPQT